MPKINIFESNSRWSLEKDINEFIQDKKVINISYSTYKVGYSIYREALVVYEDISNYPVVSGVAADEILNEIFKRRER